MISPTNQFGYNRPRIPIRIIVPTRDSPATGESKAMTSEYAQGGRSPVLEHDLLQTSTYFGEWDPGFDEAKKWPWPLLCGRRAAGEFSFNQSGLFQLSTVT